MLVGGLPETGKSALEGSSRRGRSAAGWDAPIVLSLAGRDREAARAVNGRRRCADEHRAPDRGGRLVIRDRPVEVESAMRSYVILSNWTDQGIKNSRDTIKRAKKVLMTSSWWRITP